MVTKQLHMIPIFVRTLGGLGEPAKISSPEIPLLGAEMPTSWSATKYVASAIGMLVRMHFVPNTASLSHSHHMPTAAK